MKHCQNCGEQMRDEERFCPQCGSKQPEQAVHYTEAEFEIEEPEEPAEPVQTPDSPMETIVPPKAEPKQNQEPPAPPKKRVSGALIAALIIGGVLVLALCVGILVPLLRTANRRQIVSIECGYDVVAGLRKDGTVAVSVNPQLIDPALTEEISRWTDIVQIDTTETSSYLLGLKKDGTVVFSSLSRTTNQNLKRSLERQLQSWTDIVSIDSDGNVIYALNKNGTVETAVLNDYPESERFDIIRSWKDIRKIKVIGWDLYGWKADGTVVCSASDVQNVLNPYGSSIVDLDGLSQAEAALLKNGDMVYLWEDRPESSGIRFDFPNWHDLREIIVYNRRAIGLKKDGTVVSAFVPGSEQYNPVLDVTVTIYGGNDFGQCNVADWSDIVDICGTDWATFGVKKDGTVVYTGNADWFDPDAWN